MPPRGLARGMSYHPQAYTLRYSAFAYRGKAGGRVFAARLSVIRRAATAPTADDGRVNNGSGKQSIHLARVCCCTPSARLPRSVPALQHHIMAQAVMIAGVAGVAQAREGAGHLAHRRDGRPLLRLRA